MRFRFPSIQPPPPPAPAVDPKLDKAKAKAMRANLKPSTFGSGSSASTPFGSHTDLSSMSRGGSASGSGRGSVRSAGAITIIEKKLDRGKGKEKDAAERPGDKIWDLPKSKEVQRLEGVVAALRAVQDGLKGAAVDTPPCFCQGTSRFTHTETHARGPLTPQPACTSCRGTRRSAGSAGSCCARCSLRTRRARRARAHRTRRRSSRGS